MIREGFSTGHGDSLEDLLGELSWQIKARSGNAESPHKVPQPAK
jgi:hypothetical protein